MTREKVHAMWQNVLLELENNLGAETVTNWFGDVRLYSLKDNVLVLSLGSDFQRKRILRDYMDNLLVAWKKEIPTLREVNLIVVSESSSNHPAAAGGKPPKTTRAGRKSPLGTKLAEKFTFNRFVVGKPNEFAYSVAKAVAESSTVESKYNPLFVYGGVGLGKTHLLQAIANYKCKKFPDAKVIYMTSERFTTGFISALRHKSMDEFRKELRSANIFIIDDIQFIAGKKSTQEEFFHALNELIENSCQIIASADRLPSDLEGIKERLRSRLSWGLVANIYPADYELRFGILQSQVEKMRLDIPTEVLEFLAENITSNVRELEGALTKIIAHHELMGDSLNTDMVRSVLGDFLRSQERTFNIDQIQRAVAEHYGIRLGELLSPSRLLRLSKARQVAMYLCKGLTSHSLPEIGRKFGGRDHTTVLHAVRRITKLKESDGELHEDLNLITRSLKN